MNDLNFAPELYVLQSKSQIHQHPLARLGKINRLVRIRIKYCYASVGVHRDVIQRNHFLIPGNHCKNYHGLLASWIFAIACFFHRFVIIRDTSQSEMQN